MPKSQEHLSPASKPRRRNQDEIEKARLMQEEIKKRKLRQNKFPQSLTGTMGKSAEAVRIKRNAAIEEDIRKKMKKKK